MPDHNANRTNVRMANGVYTISTVLAVGMVWGWLAVQILGMARGARVPATDVMIGAVLTFALAGVVYFAGWAWRRFWTGNRDHFFTRH